MTVTNFAHACVTRCLRVEALQDGCVTSRLVLGGMHMEGGTTESNRGKIMRAARCANPSYALEFHEYRSSTPDSDVHKWVTY